MLLFVVFISCSSEPDNKMTTDSNKIEMNSKVKTEPQTETFFLELGGEQQYIEIISTSKENPILLFVHGGPAWPQTPQLRYFNKQLADFFTLVIWEQRGAGKNYEKNPTPKNLTINQIVSDGLELTTWLRKNRKQDKIYLAGYSFGSLIGVKMVEQNPEDYQAYFGISQFINKTEGMKISRNWLKDQASKKNDTVVLQKVDTLGNASFFKDQHTRFFYQYLLVNQYGGVVYDTSRIAEIEKSQQAYEDYKTYDWVGVWQASATELQKEFYVEDVRQIQKLAVPVILFEGRHDWNVPSVLAESWLNKLDAPYKEIVWLEKSGHSPLEEQPEEFNEKMIQVLNKLN